MRISNSSVKYINRLWLKSITAWQSVNFQTGTSDHRITFALIRSSIENQIVHKISKIHSEKCLEARRIKKNC